MKNDVIAVSVPTDKIVINQNEIAVRLKVSRGYTNDLIEQCLSELMKVLNYKYAYKKVGVKHVGDGVCILGNETVKSYKLCKALDGCNQAFLLGVTTGIGVDRLLAKYSITSQAKNFITDALSSAAAESLCDYADNAIRNFKIRPIRFSPGYGDLPLSFQPSLLEALDAYYTLGITINKSLLMTPVKSITAIMGVYDD